MKLGATDIYVQKSRDGQYWAGSKTYGIEWHQTKDGIETRTVSNLYRRVLRHEMTDSQIVSTWCSLYGIDANGVAAGISESAPQKPLVDTKSLAQKLINFFSEFHFEPNFRFLNTLALCCSKSDMRAYIMNYFTLTDSPFTGSIGEKLKSQEFSEIADDLLKVAPTTQINKRFELYYGSQGTGKTTQAMKKASKCMVCHSAMLPQDLMEDFSFTDGKAGFNPSVLYRAMIEGYTIVLDEINLLPFESLRFLQSILDGKEEITYKGQTVKIADGFKIIGTMNLVVNGAVFSLPEPLIDRASSLKEFKLTASDLVAAFN